MFGFSKPHTGKRVAVADVGSASVGVAIATLSKKGPARIEAYHRALLPIEERSPEQAIVGISTALTEATEKIAEMGKKLGSVQSVHAVIRGQWTRSKTIHAVKKFPKEEKVSKEHISELAKEALGSETEFDRANLIEANVIRVELNGYPTAQPVGKKAKTVFISALVSETDPRIKSAVDDALARTFSVKPTFRSGSAALLSTLRDLSRSHTDYLVANMAEGATVLFGVHKGTPIQHTVVPEGTLTILKRVAGNKMPEETLSLIRMLARDHCEDAACEEVRTNMGKVEQELIRIFGEVMGKMATPYRLPNTLVLAIEPDMAHWLSGFFSRIDFTQFTVTAQPFSVLVLTPEHLRRFVELSAKKNPDIGIMVATALVNSEQQGT